MGLACAAGCGARSQLAAPGSLTGGGGTGGVVACTTGTVTLSRAQPAVLFVLDHSRSMLGNLGQNNGQASRWEILTDALSATLPSVDDAMEIGALLYPTGSSDQDELTCTVPGAPDLMPATGHVGPLLDLMNAAESGSGTPTADAISVAAAALAGVHAATSARALVLATDGGPNCNEDLDPDECTCVTANQGCNQSKMCLDDTRTVERISAAHAQGIPTYVIGIQDEGDTTLSGVLDAMADAGGRPKAGGSQHYYAATSGAELTTALAAIRDQVGLCTYLISSVPDEGGTITMSLGGTMITFDPSGMDGWMWGNKDNGEVLLLGSACAAATADANVTPTAEVKCAGP
ncbi:MAG: hypothetical protein QM820_30475 [Minicystis sp.]